MYSKQQKVARMTFLQAKFHNNKKTYFPFKFRGEYFQYELLSIRPIIKKLRNFNSLLTSYRILMMTQLELLEYFILTIIVKLTLLLR